MSDMFTSEVLKIAEYVFSSTGAVIPLEEVSVRVHTADGRDMTLPALAWKDPDYFSFLRLDRSVWPCYAGAWLVLIPIEAYGTTSDMSRYFRGVRVATGVVNSGSDAPTYQWGLYVGDQPSELIDSACGGAWWDMEVEGPSSALFDLCAVAYDRGLDIPIESRYRPGPADPTADMDPYTLGPLQDATAEQIAYAFEHLLKAYDAWEVANG